MVENFLDRFSAHRAVTGYHGGNPWATDFKRGAESRLATLRCASSYNLLATRRPLRDSFLA
jgi:hypothetical protein